ncbi:MAG TPA: hypothetical protein VMU94_25105 [Streptosporangiaceae bacterium]|nr:hypothetical protein [Streptosporangiaceae bacterium]
MGSHKRRPKQAPAGQHGTFILTDGGDDSDRRERVHSAGFAGHGIYWNTSDPGDHSLVVTPSCLF